MWQHMIEVSQLNTSALGEVPIRKVASLHQ